MSEDKKKLGEPCKIRIFPNYNKKGPQPDYKGVLTDEMGDEFVISCWKTKMSDGNFYLAGRIIRKSDLDKMFGDKKPASDQEKKSGAGNDFDLFT